MTRRVEDLVRLICPSPEDPLAPVLRAWCGTSRAFLTFAEANATKIRRKARLAPGEDELGDLLAELGVAGLLVREGRVTLRYEPFASGGTRG
ncbi:hypothetical protein, partial [Deinococcus pimensis]|uniref:hypothetical protein n=1 Tax=Deinococcus pimensis TaxID=309888 RepID=UPI0005EB9E9F